METIETIQKAIDYIEENIAQELDLAAVASKACMSVSHFQRVFLAICGISVGEYIRNRKLTLAGEDVTTTSAKIIDISQKYGYESPEGFSRAFTRFHNASPTKARNRGEVNSFAKISIISMFRKEDDMENTTNPACSFCGKDKSERKILVKSENAYICEVCVSVCNGIVEEEMNKCEAVLDMAKA